MIETRKFLNHPWRFGFGQSGIFLLFLTRHNLQTLEEQVEELAPFTRISCAKDNVVTYAQLDHDKKGKRSELQVKTRFVLKTLTTELKSNSGQKCFTGAFTQRFFFYFGFFYNGKMETKPTPLGG